MFLEQQRYWLELVNAQHGRDDREFLRHVVPAEQIDFADPPGWPERRARIYLLNQVEVLRASHAALESGRELDLEMLNYTLGESRLSLVPEPRADEVRLSRRECLRFRPPDRDGNPGTVRVRDAVARAFFYFAQYVDYRREDPAYPDAAPDRFQVRACLRPDCDTLFVRSPELPLYCSLNCAREDR